MTLDFDLSKIENRDTVCKNKEGELSAVTHTLIFAGLVTGINEITDKNWPEFYARLNIYERLFGSYLRDKDGNEVVFTPQDIRDHIGLRTNVNPLSKTAFKNNIFERAFLEAVNNAKTLEVSYG